MTRLVNFHYSDSRLILPLAKILHLKTLVVFLSAVDQEIFLLLPERGNFSYSLSHIEKPIKFRPQDGGLRPSDLRRLLSYECLVYSVFNDMKLPDAHVGFVTRRHVEMMKERFPAGPLSDYVIFGLLGSYPVPFHLSKATLSGMADGRFRIEPKSYPGTSIPGVGFVNCTVQDLNLLVRFYKCEIYSALSTLRPTMEASLFSHRIYFPDEGRSLLSELNDLMALSLKLFNRS